MVDSRCGLSCAECKRKELNGCGGCIKSNGPAFDGKCPIADCCKNKGLAHCGECDIIPCDILYSSSYLDPKRKDNPPGKRIEQCRRWAGELGNQAWENVLLTDSGFYRDGDFSNPLDPLVERLKQMLGKPFSEAKVLLVPTAAMKNKLRGREIADSTTDELTHLGVSHGNITVHNIDGAMSEQEAMEHDIIYFTGGKASYLAGRARKAGFDIIVKKMVYANKVYVGVSGGSMFAMADFNVDKARVQYPAEYAGLALINAYFTVHCPPGTPNRDDFPLPHISLSRGQAIAVRWDGYEVIM